MSNPESGPENTGLVGSWQTVSLGIPDFLAQTRQAVDAFFSALIQLLNILLSVLEIIKVFAIGFLDPLVAIIEALLVQIEALIEDLRNAGIYIHGDFYILEGPTFSNLLGGFSAYERRMIGRLTDRTDPNRPDISGRSTVVAVFLYVSVDLTSVSRLVAFIQGILALFNRKIDLPRSLGTPVNVQATYGTDGASIFSFKKNFFPDARFRLSPDRDNGNVNTVNLTWQMAPSPTGTITNFAQLPPRGFLVDFTTIIQPLVVGYEKPVQGSQEENSLSPTQPAPKRTGGTCVDTEGNPIGITGGSDTLLVEPFVRFNGAVTPTGELKPLSARYYLVKNLADPAPIPPSQLREGERYYLQRRFFVPFTQNLFFFGKGYGGTFSLEDMPFNAEFELQQNGTVERINDEDQGTRYFVRVRAVSNRIDGPSDFRYRLGQLALDQPGEPVVLNPAIVEADPTLTLTSEDIGPPSAPLEVIFPDANTDEYLTIVASALALIVLCRADLSVKLGSGNVPEDGSAAPQYLLDYPPAASQLQGGQPLVEQWTSFVGTARKPTQLEDIAAFIVPQLIGRKRGVNKFFQSVTEEVVQWRQDLYYRCINLASVIYKENRPSPTVEQLVIGRCQDLLNYNVVEAALDLENVEFPRAQLENQGILDLLLDTRSFAGLAPNRRSIFSKDEPDSIRTVIRRTLSLNLLQRGPHFFSVDRNTNGKGRGSVDDGVPVLYDVNFNEINAISFFRNLISDEVYEQAAFALRIATGPVVRPQEKGWIAFRLFPGGLPDVDRFFDQLLALLNSVKAALQAIATLIRQFIEFLQSRIIELQAVLNRINALIQNLLNLFITIPATSGLVTIANGTDGTLAAFANAGNKPFDSSSAYGGGVVLLAGGIPTIALDIFKALVMGMAPDADVVEG